MSARHSGQTEEEHPDNYHLEKSPHCQSRRRRIFIIIRGGRRGVLRGQFPGGGSVPNPRIPVRQVPLTLVRNGLPLHLRKKLLIPRQCHHNIAQSFVNVDAPMIDSLASIRLIIPSRGLIIPTNTDRYISWRLQQRRVENFIQQDFFRWICLLRLSDRISSGLAIRACRGWVHPVP